MEFVRIGDRVYYRFTGEETVKRQQFEQSILKSDMVQTLLENLINMMVIAEQDSKRAWCTIKESLAYDLGVDESEFQNDISYEWFKGGIEISLETLAIYLKKQNLDFLIEKDLNIELGK